MLCARRVWSAGSLRRGLASGDDSPLKRLLDGAATYGEPAAQGEGELRWATQPYARRGPEAPVRRVEPADTTVLLFPGQGSQRVGMGRKLAHLPAARDLYELASKILKWDVWRVCTEGPADELNARCQPAIVVTSLAALEALRDTRPAALGRARAAAGFSLGELAALAWAGALPLERALRLAEIRQTAMAAAAKERPQALLTVWLAADANLPHAMLRAREHAETQGLSDPVCQVANYLYPHCKVVGGDEEALKFLEKRGAEFGIRRSARVAGAAGAFHTPLMAPVTNILKEALMSCEVEAPRVKVVSAVDAKPYSDARAVRKTLAKHAASPQRWEQTLHALYARPQGERFPLTVALGPGTALRATLKQVNAKAWDSSIQIDV
ncbi:probable malonyl-CoA-acyl carrier protein transacylase, mitochondrial [Cydia splendana]|uniref:probable malonyl-CoA-acyl carrier protein transacylase, mitochondrial n=1 Tax=Cydia splendana TaxID=1100963 RepID=UPI00300C8E67